MTETNAAARNGTAQNEAGLGQAGPNEAVLSGAGPEENGALLGGGEAFRAAGGTFQGDERREPSRLRLAMCRCLSLLYRALSSSAAVYVLAIVVSLAVGAILMLVSGADVVEGYSAMIRGSVFNWKAQSFQGQIAPLTSSIFSSLPLIIAGLALALGFRGGLFNIGGTGQIIAGAIGAAWVGFQCHMPAGVHLLACLLAAVVCGGIYGFIAGFLKATTGANEVIVTIMLNSVATLGLAQLLTYQSFRRPGSGDPRSPTIDATAQLPETAPPFQINGGVVIALLATVFVWWYLERSTWGFELRAVGANPDAAKTAGMSIGKVTTVTLTLSGALCGLAGGVTMTGDLKYLTDGVAGSTGFDAITVALLGRNRPVGTFFAGILFGVFRAGGRTMDAQADVPIDMVLILQSVIVLLIAAPAFVRWLFRLPTGGSDRWRAYLTLAREKAAGQAEASPDSAAQAEDRAPGSGRLRTEAQETDDKKEALR